MVESKRDPTNGSIHIVLRPNASLTKRQALAVVMGVGFFMASIAAGFTLLGLWLVVPFSGAEWLLLAWCFGVTFKKCAVRETITITESAVLVEKESGKGAEANRFQRAWVALDLSDPPHKNHPSRLAFRLHGRQVEIGGFLVESERQELACELRRILREGK